MVCAPQRDLPSTLAQSKMPVSKPISLLLKVAKAPGEQQVSDAHSCYQFLSFARASLNIGWPMFSQNSVSAHASLRCFPPMAKIVCIQKMGQGKAILLGFTCSILVNKIFVAIATGGGFSVVRVLALLCAHCGHAWGTGLGHRFPFFCRHEMWHLCCPLFLRMSIISRRYLST